MPTVLVVDDEPDIRDVIRLNLEVEGYRVVTAGDGDAALRAVEQERPDAIFLDVLMPGVDGWTVLRRLKAGDDPSSEIPVVMVTALSQTEERLRGAIEGAVRHLTKPFHPRDLLDALRELLAADAAPEREVRRQVRHAALESLARIESGGSGASSDAPRVHLTRLERSPEATPAATPERPSVAEARARLQALTARQHRLLERLHARFGSVTAVAEELGTSRSSVYAGLRRVVHRLRLRNTTELLRMLADGELLDTPR